MMLKVYNSRQKKRLADELGRQYGVDDSIFDGYDVIGSGGDAWVVSRGCLEQDLGGLRVDSMGLQVLRGGKPTIHGIQLLFTSAHMVDLSEEEAKAFILGEKVDKKGLIASYNGFPVDSSVESGGGILRKVKNNQ